MRLRLYFTLLLFRYCPSEMLNGKPKHAHIICFFILSARKFLSYTRQIRFIFSIHLFLLNHQFFATGNRKKNIYYERNRSMKRNLFHVESGDTSRQIGWNFLRADCDVRIGPAEWPHVSRKTSMKGRVRTELSRLRRARRTAFKVSRNLQSFAPFLSYCNTVESRARKRKDIITISI